MKKKLPLIFKLPHLGYTVEVRLLDKKNRALDRSFAETHGYAYRSVIFLRNWPVKPLEVPTLAHELVHVLKNICDCRMMSIEKESEHLAYIMQYLMNGILGYEYKI